MCTATAFSTRDYSLHSLCLVLLLILRYICGPITFKISNVFKLVQHVCLAVICLFVDYVQMAIMRCSQPNVGPNGRRCKEDELVVNSVVGIGRRGYILDTRSQNIVKLATAKGKQLISISLKGNTSPRIVLMYQLKLYLNIVVLLY